MGSQVSAPELFPQRCVERSTLEEPWNVYCLLIVQCTREGVRDFDHNSHMHPPHRVRCGLLLLLLLLFMLLVSVVVCCCRLPLICSTNTCRRSCRRNLPTLQAALSKSTPPFCTYLPVHLLSSAPSTARLTPKESLTLSARKTTPDKGSTPDEVSEDGESEDKEDGRKALTLESEQSERVRLDAEKLDAEKCGEGANGGLRATAEKLRLLVQSARSGYKPNFGSDEMELERQRVEAEKLQKRPLVAQELTVTAERLRMQVGAKASRARIRRGRGGSRVTDVVVRMRRKCPEVGAHLPFWYLTPPPPPPLPLLLLLLLLSSSFRPSRFLDWKC